MAGIFPIQPQRVPLVVLTGTNGQQTPLYMEQPWYRALEVLSKVTIPVGPGGAGITFDTLPAFQYGGTVFPSGENILTRLPGQYPGHVLYDGGPGVAPYWGELPAPPVVQSLQSLLCDDQGRLLLDSNGQILTDD